MRKRLMNQKVLRVCLFILTACTSFPPIPSVTKQPEKIDRMALVHRHAVVVRKVDPMGTLAVGNGEFAFNLDVTGLQSYPETYAKTLPLGILSTWGWHRFPNPHGYSLDRFSFTSIAKYQRAMVYPKADSKNPSADAAHLRGNPHRFGLGRIGLELTHADGSKAKIDELNAIEQRLDLWTGIVTSTFELDGIPICVQTAVHPKRDEVATIITSPLIAKGQLQIRVSFPYASAAFGPDYQDDSQPQAHHTVILKNNHGATFKRTLDNTYYQASMRWSPDSRLTEPLPHQFLLRGQGKHLELSAWFAPSTVASEPDTAEEVLSASRQGWERYWRTGGVIDLSGNNDPRAAELERRLVLSQYVMAVHDASSLPPQETGLGANSWFGKFHMEMYWWHSAHWALWGRPEILERSLDSLSQLQGPARAMAKRQQCKGSKWPKMTGPDGEESPSGVGPVLLWQQAHPIYLAELVYRARRDRKILERYRQIVFETADYMATFVDFDPVRGRYVLGPGVMPADEGQKTVEQNLNPGMELGYWRWALETALEWQKRLGIPPDPLWQTVANQILPPPIRNGVYVTLEKPETSGASWMATWLYGILPGHGIDREVMRRTLDEAATSRLKATPGAVTWGLAMVAMCAARMNDPELAIHLLVAPHAEGANPFRASGYTVRRPEQTPLYMPANGGWLAAAAMMAAGWDGVDPAITHPGFPRNWKIRSEGLVPIP